MTLAAPTRSLIPWTRRKWITSRGVYRLLKPPLEERNARTALKFWGKEWQLEKLQTSLPRSFSLPPRFELVNVEFKALGRAMSWPYRGRNYAFYVHFHLSHVPPGCRGNGLLPEVCRLSLKVELGRDVFESLDITEALYTLQPSLRACVSRSAPLRQ